MRSLHVIILFCLTITITVYAKLTCNGLNNLRYNFRVEEDIKVEDVNEKWIEQPLDQFDPHENRTFKMRYYENLQFWQPNGTIYVFIGDGWLSPFWIKPLDGLNYLIVEMAKESKGALFSIEYRYFGKSAPNITNENNPEYFKYLNSKQALADVASFIKMLKSDPKYCKSPVVVMGCGYGGNLAAWMRMFYPDLVDAGVAGSAPVLAKTDFHEYLDIVRYTYEKYGPKDCLNKIANIFNIFEGLLKTAKGREVLKKQINICEYSDLTTLEHQECLFTWFYAVVKGPVELGGVEEVIRFCKMLGTTELTLDFSHLFDRSKLQPENCLNLDICLNSTLSNDRAWIYRYCSEYGHLQISSSEKQPFVHWNHLNWWLQFCKQVGFTEDIEKRMNARVARTNEIYGGQTPKVTKVVFTHGDVDPWHPLGVLRDLGPDAPVIMVNGTTTCEVLLVKRKEYQYIKDLIKKWIAQK